MGSSMKTEVPADQSGRRGIVFEIVILVILVAMIAASPLPFGSASVWSQGLLFCLAAGTLCVWAARGVREGALRFVRTPVWIVLAGFIAVVWFQCLPLPVGLVAALSPEAAYAHQSAALPGEEIQWATLSLLPHATNVALFRLSLLAAIFFVTVQAMHRRWQLMALTVAVLTTALFEWGYGGIRLATDSTHIFWNEPEFVSESMTGTFLNSSHLAGLLSMAFLLALGLWMAGNGTCGAGFCSGRSRFHLCSDRVKRIALVFCGIAFALGVCFTRSRSGLLSGLISIFLLALCIGLALRLKARTMGLLAFVSLALCLGHFIALDLVLTWFEEGSVTGVTWADRLDLYGSAWIMVSTFPLLGSGLGTFEAVFPRFQSGRFGDRVAEHLHSDWLQLGCEVGTLGFLIILAAGILVVASTLRRGLRRSDPFCRWLSVGATTGCASVLIQGLLDCNLSRITSNGIVFSVLLGVAFVAAHMPGTDTAGKPLFRTARLGLGPLPVRAAALVGVVGILANVAVVAFQRSKAEIGYNLHLAAAGEATDRYFFLAAEPGGNWLARPSLAGALELDPEDPRYAHRASQFFRNRVAEACRRKAMEFAAAHLGALDVEEEEIARFASVLTPGVRQSLRKEHLADLVSALKSVDRAVRLSPTNAAFRLERAALLLEIWGGRQESGTRPGQRIEKDANLAMALAPNKPEVLYRAGSLMMDLATACKSDHARTDCLAAARRGFRRALASFPGYADPVYDLLLETAGDLESLFKATPETVDGYTHLADRLIAEGAWGESLVALKNLDRIDGDLPSRGVKRFAAERRAVVYERLRQWSRRRAEVKRLQNLIEKDLAGSVEAARRLVALGRTSEGHLEYQKILRCDRNHPAALVGLARLLSLPEAGDIRCLGTTSLDLLLRLVVSGREVDASLLEEAVAVVDALRPAARDALRSARFIRCAARHLAGYHEEATRGLSVLAAEGPGSEDPLVHLFLGRAAEARGRMGEAASAYRAVLARVPTHLSAWLGLGRVDASAAGSVSFPAETLARLCRTEVEFGGQVRLVGYSMEAAKAPRKSTVTTVWECGVDPMDGYAIHLEVLGVGGRVVSRSTTRLGNGSPDTWRTGALVTSRQEVHVSSGIRLCLSLRKENPPVGGEAVLLTDAREPCLWIESMALE